MKKSYTYPAVLNFTDKHIEIWFPDLEEAISQADNVEQAVRRANEVLKLTIESRLEDKEEIPQATPLNEITLKENQRTIVATAVLNEKVTYVKKTLTIPDDLNEAAEVAGLNFSQVLQRALREELNRN
ncbi:Predicted nuclease of the RNAse H fold, HicB family [Paenibacillus sophorae]|uniref:Predicted nuclease of the RNAse H fold, HicB family n=1 Tax=Paenibacillus sophorae TaxID=1333845 RepID=A0A1H8VRE1_9BACL|nr:type II toxin-antitoxin system HicB family antitoxin [Paenibacillus sophorae]QWU15662.1 type II toxin-antitoxin system HicB family antitoxin [Paenibacillus sophorae]SEP17843.1 Predicted nuclease of the RNAse H fold, HicB family [Paenibacillus sophorae]